ncbi:MAG: hypothetical protein KGZ86_06715 [Candidatus Latescibacteria bacterium]|nr:hypothetical protein [Candidatus Latescibacterota bacterium]
MTFEQLTELVVSNLQKSNIQYMLTGALAINYYGVPRMTHDIDIIIQITSKDIRKIQVLFDNDFFVGEESIRSALAESSMFNVIHKETGYKVDFWILKEDEYNRTAFVRRKECQYQQKQIYIASPEDMIIIKLEWYKMSDIDKHYFDVINLYNIQRDNLDEKYIIYWCQKKSLLDLWKKIQKDIK